MEPWRKFVYIGIGFFESFIFSGLIFGWPSLVFVLQREGIYSSLCKEEENALALVESFNVTNNSSSLLEDEFIKCKNQDDMFSLLYSIMLAVFGFPSVAIGFSLDLWGLRVTRLFGNTMVTAGFLSLSFATTIMPWTIWPGMLMICLGANTLRLCGLQYANAWPEKRSTIMFLYTSAHAISTTVFLMFQYASLSGIPLRTTSLTLSLICALTFISTFILPKTKVSEPITKIRTKTEEEKESLKTIHPMIEETTKETPKLTDSILTTSFLLHMLWMTNVYFLRFFTTSFSAWSWKTTSDAKDVAFYNSIAGACSLISPLISPLGGVVTDWMLRRAGKEEDKVEKLASRFQAPSIVLSIATTMLLLVYICKLSYSPLAVYVSIAIVSLARPLVIGSVYTYVSIRFYPEHFNRLVGLGFTIISAVCLLQYPMYLWMFHSDYMYAVSGISFILIIAVTYASPGHLLVRGLVRKYAEVEVRYRK